MICPCEKKGETSVVDSRPTEDGTAIRRRRMCVCGERFTTFERIQFRELMVVKKNGRKSAFDRDKLFMEIALDLAKSRQGLTGTNPSVGCVIVKNDNIISIGQTSYNGRPHAESVSYTHLTLPTT